MGFDLLWYCSGTVAGAVGTGARDALFGGIVGLLIGAGIFAELYPRLRTRILEWGKFPAVTVPEVLNRNLWIVIVQIEVFTIGFLMVLRYFGL
ncbi:MAG: hypothetical protein WCF90_05990 [Methanomicrobiales archaeon]